MAIAIGTSETAQGSIERSGRANLDRMLPYGLIAPAVFVAFATAVVPMGYAIWLSLQDWYLLRRPTPIWGGLVNYIQLFHDASLWAAFGRTWIWTIGTVFVELILGVPIALLFNRESAVSRTASALILLPWVTPFVVLGFGWRFLLDGDVGPIQGVLKMLGISGTGSVLNDPARALDAHNALCRLEQREFTDLQSLRLPAGRFGMAEPQGCRCQPTRPNAACGSNRSCVGWRSTPFPAGRSPAESAVVTPCNSHVVGYQSVACDRKRCRLG